MGALRLVDADGDGMVTLDETESITLLSDRKDKQLSIFSYTTIKRFPEFRYFTGLTFIGTIFEGCQSLEYVELPVYENYNGMFAKCISLQSVIIPEGVKTIGKGFCSQCIALQLLSLPSSLISIGSGLIWGVNGITTLLCYAITPPAVDSSLNGNPVAIYVPDESIDEYKSASVWSSHSSIIKPLSEYIS